MLDCGHATKDFVGHSAEEYFERNHAIIDYIEFKDYAPESDLRTEVGRGRCNWPAVAASIRRHGYAGWIVVEQNGALRAPKVASAESFHYARYVLDLKS
jgi:sugar phosphate isomerase/epimerase